MGGGAFPADYGVALRLTEIMLWMLRQTHGKTAGFFRAMARETDLDLDPIAAALGEIHFLINQWDPCLAEEKRYAPTLEDGPLSGYLNPVTSWEFKEALLGMAHGLAAITAILEASRSPDSLRLAQNITLALDSFGITLPPVDPRSPEGIAIHRYRERVQGLQR